MQCLRWLLLFYMLFVHGILFLTWGFGMVLTRYNILGTLNYHYIRIHQKFYALFTFVTFKHTELWMVFHT